MKRAQVSHTSLRALAVARDAFQRSNALTSLAKAHIRLSEFDEARVCLNQALENNKDQKDAFQTSGRTGPAAGSSRQGAGARRPDVCRRCDPLARAGRAIAGVHVTGPDRRSTPRPGLDQFLLETDPHHRAGGRLLRPSTQSLQKKSPITPTFATNVMEPHRLTPGVWTNLR